MRYSTVLAFEAMRLALLDAQLYMHSTYLVGWAIQDERTRRMHAWMADHA